MTKNNHETLQLQQAQMAKKERNLKNWNKIFQTSFFIFVLCLCVNIIIYFLYQGSDSPLPTWYQVLRILYQLSFIGTVVGFWGKLTIQKEIKQIQSKKNTFKNKHHQ